MDRQIALVFALCLLLCVPPVHAQRSTPNPDAQPPVTPLCPIAGLQPRDETFTGNGAILTAFAPGATWHYDVVTGRRFPVPDTSPCGRTCRLSADGRSFVYFNPLLNAHQVLRLDGANRRTLTVGAADVIAWDDATWLAWTPGVSAFLLRGGERQSVPLTQAYSVQPGGAWQITTRFDGRTFQRALSRADGTDSTSIALGVDLPWFNSYAWSPDGSALAYVIPVRTRDGTFTAELALTPLDRPAQPRTLTRLTDAYTSARINGIAVDDLAWSPDSTRIAFWVVAPAPPPEGSPPPDPAPQATIHIVSLSDGTTTAYCGFSTDTHTPNTPRLFWSPDGAYLAFAADVTDDMRAAFIAALDPASGAYILLTEGIYGAFGIPDIYAWGVKP
jgi:hypothetical protein